MLYHYKSNRFLRAALRVHYTIHLSPSTWSYAAAAHSLSPDELWWNYFPAHTINSLVGNTLPGISTNYISRRTRNRSIDSRKKRMQTLVLLRRHPPYVRIRSCDVIYELLKHLIQFMCCCCSSSGYSRSPNSRVLWISHDEHFLLLPPTPQCHCSFANPMHLLPHLYTLSWSILPWMPHIQ